MHGAVGVVCDVDHVVAGVATGAAAAHVTVGDRVVAGICGMRSRVAVVRHDAGVDDGVVVVYIAGGGVSAGVGCVAVG